MKIKLHIGLHKTGTSSFQHNCHKNAKELIKKGVFWPTSESFSNLSTQHSIIPWNYRLNSDINTVKIFFERTLNLAEEAHCHTILISGEEFSRLNDEELNRLRLTLPYADYEIYIVFRNIKHFLISMFKKEMELGRIDFSINNFLDQIYMLHPADVLKRWEANFGKNNVKIELFENMLPNLVENYFEWFEIRDILNPIEIHENKSVDIITSVILGGLLKNQQENILIDSRKLFEQIFFGKVFKFEIEQIVAEHLMSCFSPRLNHQRLSPFLDILMKDELQLNEFEMSDYAIKLKDYLIQLLNIIPTNQH